jgi:signal transduction histidine kinase
MPADVAAMRVRVDRDRLLQVLSNLIGNALKYGKEGQEIVVSAGLTADAQAVRICVRDRGPGIELDDQPHIFERYWSSERDARKGTGLGLYIAKAIVEAHGGRIGVESKPGDGAMFWFTLPK